MSMLLAMYGAIAGLVIISLVNATRKGVPFSKQFGSIRKEFTETVTGQLDLPDDMVAAKGTPVFLQVFFVIFMVMIVFISLFLCSKLEEGFGYFWLQFPFGQIKSVSSLEK